MLQRIRDLPDQGLYGVIGVLAVVALYVIGFVIKNSKNVSVDFVLFSAGVPLITLMVVMLLFGALLGVALTLVLARRRRSARPAARARCRRPATGTTPPPRRRRPRRRPRAPPAPRRRRRHLNLDLWSRFRRPSPAAREPRDRLLAPHVDLVAPRRC